MTGKEMEDVEIAPPAEQHGREIDAPLKLEDIEIPAKIVAATATSAFMS